MMNNLKTPCFVLNEQELSNSTQQLNLAFSKYFGQSHIGYSVKTNSLPYALAKAKDLGCKAEVVSDDELDLAIECGFQYKDIVFNGPMKSKSHYLEAIKGGAIVNIETHREIGWLKELPIDRIYNIGIRLSINISDISPEDADGDNDFSRFGFNDTTDEFSKALDAIAKTPQVRLAGLHIHRTSHSRSTRFYKNSVSYAARIINKYNLKIDYLDVGGGYYGIFPNAPTFNDYAKVMHESLKQYNLEHLTIIIEPGNALSASAFNYYSTVIDVKDLPGCRILTTDGSRNDVDPFFHKTKYMIDIRRKNENREIAPLQIICGATCLEYDQLCHLENQPELCEGDIIEYKNVGAYTLTLTPMFINYFPRIYSLTPEGLKIVREKWTAKEYIQKSKIKL